MEDFDLQLIKYRTMNKLVALIFGLFLAAGSYAANDTLVVKTSAVCGMCKTTIEHEINYEKGVRFVELDLETKECMIIYNNDKTDPETLKAAIAAIGYQADDVPADAEAYEELPGCCKLGSSCDDK